MTFLQPAFLWSFLFLAPLAAIYLLKVRPTRKDTTVLFLWENLLQEKRSSALFRRLRDVFSLLLLALALSAICLSLSRPVLTRTEDDKELILLIDNSASMSAQPGGRSRLDLAKEAARKIISAIDMERRVAVAHVASRLKYTVTLTTNLRLLRDGVDCIGETDLPFRKAALAPVTSNRELYQDCRVILISDGCFEGHDQLEGIELLKVGAPLGNAGIVAFDVRRIPGEGDPLGLYFRLVSSFPEPKTLDVVLSHESPESIQKVVSVELEPGLNEPEIFTVPKAKAGKWQLRLEVQDPLPKDDVAYAVVPEAIPIKVAVQGDEGGYFLRHCVEAFRKIPNGMVTSRADADVTLAAGSVRGIASPDSGAYIIFKPAGSSPFWRSIEDELDPSLAKALIADHPAIRFCRMDSISFAGKRRIEPAEGSVVLAEDEQGTPLLYKSTQGDRAAYVINMDPEQSDFFLSTYFPVMVYSMARDLMHRGDERPPAYGPGDMVKLPTREPSCTVVDPAGQVRKCRSATFGPLDRLGFYEVRDGQSAHEIACSILGRPESVLDNSRVLQTAQSVSHGLPMQYLLIGLALLLVALESVLYHRRKVG